MSRRKPIKISRNRHLQVVYLLSLAVVALFLFVSPYSMAESKSEAESSLVAFSETKSLELPFSRDTTFIIHNRVGRYTLLYDTAHRQSRWVAYILTRGECTVKGVERYGKFYPDSIVILNQWPTARTANYTNSGFDRGHLLPSADRNATKQENRSTFALSNVSPQYPGLNRKQWKNLEEKVRNWALTYDSLYIVTGNIIDDDAPTLKGRVAVPKKFYKAILMKKDGRWHSVAFLMENREQLEGSWSDYKITVRELENFTGINFFYQLPIETANSVESIVEPNIWD